MVEAWLCADHAFSVTNLQRGFGDAGVWPFSCKCMLSRYHGRLGKLRRAAAMEEAVRQLAGIVEAKGTVEETDFDAVGVPKTAALVEREQNPHAKNLDDMSVGRRRCVVLNALPYLETESRKRGEAKATAEAKKQARAKRKQEREAAKERKKQKGDEEREQVQRWKAAEASEDERHDEPGAEPWRCRLCGLSRLRAAARGLSGTGKLQWKRCGECKHVYCPRCRPSDAIWKRHRSICAVYFCRTPPGSPQPARPHKRKK